MHDLLTANHIRECIFPPEMEGGIDGGGGIKGTLVTIGAVSDDF